jgi:aspartokinase-like uncharacterized kinase
MTEDLVVVKVGGSLFGQPNLGPRLRAWLKTFGRAPILLVAGGGRAAEVVRELDRCHDLGEEGAHWLALRSLSVTAHFLQILLPGAEILGDIASSHRIPCVGRPMVLDPYAFLSTDEGRPGCLAHTWDVTSDAIAARVAVVSGARELILLKSVAVPQDVNWATAANLGLVDRAFAGVLTQVPTLKVTALNFLGLLNG